MAKNAKMFQSKNANTSQRLSTKPLTRRNATRLPRKNARTFQNKNAIIYQSPKSTMTIRLSARSSQSHTAILKPLKYQLSRPTPNVFGQESTLRTITVVNYNFFTPLAIAIIYLVGNVRCASNNNNTAY